MTIRVLDQETESLELGQESAAGKIPDSTQGARIEAAGPGFLSQVFNRFFSAVLASGRAGAIGLPAPSLEQAEGLSEQEREWVELNLWYDLHL